MSARINASGDSYSAVWALGAQSAFSMCCWFKLASDRNAYTGIINTDGNATSGNGVYLQTDADGTTLELWDDQIGHIVFGQNMAVGVWYFIGLAKSGTSAVLYYRALSSPTLTAVAATVSSSSIVNRFWFGNDQFDEWVDGSVFAGKHWLAQLSFAEMQAESYQIAPARTANLTAFHPVQRAEAADYSGNGRTLTVAGSIDTDDNPPIPWQGLRQRLILNAPAVAAPAYPYVPISQYAGFH